MQDLQTHLQPEINQPHREGICRKLTTHYKMMTDGGRFNFSSRETAAEYWRTCVLPLLPNELSPVCCQRK